MAAANNTPLPLDKRTIPVTNKNGLQRSAPAIHSMWTVPRTWTGYHLPPSQEGTPALPGALDHWVGQAKRILSELCWLLRLPCHKFWSQICNDDGLHRWLGELLEVFPREHDRDSSWDLIIKQINTSILQKMFLVHVRLCTYKESATEFFNPTAWGHMLYDQFLIELPKLMDMCVLFSPCNKNITSKMVGNVFKHQPQYMEDLVETGLTMDTALETATEQYQVLCLSPPSSFSLVSLLDLSIYSLDISLTLFSLVSVFPPSSSPLHQTGLEVKLAMFYTSVVTPLLTLSHKYLTAGVLTDADHTSLISRLNNTRHNLVNTVREILGQVCLANILFNQEQDLHMVQVVEEFLTVFTSILSERTFLLDYDHLYPLRQEFLLFEEAGAEIDPTRKHYILDALNPTQSNSFTSTLGATVGGEKSKATTDRQTVMTASGGAASATVANTPSGVEIDSLVSTVRDLLPYLGEGFVERVLVEYQYKVDSVINALLENNLPPHLAELDQSLAKEERKVSRAPSPVMRSVFDEDEFDVNSRDMVDTSRIHRGKKDKTRDAKKLLDDKRDIVQLKDKFEKLGIVTDEVYYKGNYEDEHGYDDEYDDTYDDTAVGEQEPDAGEELGRAFVLPVALGGGKIRQQVIDADSDSDDDESDLKPNGNFVRNPEDLRQDQERRRAEKMSRGHKKGAPGGGGGGGAPSNGVPPHRDVVGRAKGQGQEKNVLIARARKNANKGKGQRSGADRKAAKGMF